MFHHNLIKGFVGDGIGRMGASIRNTCGMNTIYKADKY